MQVNPLPQVGNVLRALIRHARDIILVNEEHGVVMTVADRQLLHIDDGLVGDASNAVEPGAAFAFQFRRPLGLATQKRIGAKDHGAATGNNQRIETQGNHTEKENKEDEQPTQPRNASYVSLSAYDGSVFCGSGWEVTEVPACGNPKC